MKKIRIYTLLLLAMATVFGCSKYDDTELRNDVNDLKSRVEKLETWCNTANSQISALQGLVDALEEKDMVTGVTPLMEGSVEVGYTIRFSKGNPITIKHGKEGLDGVTPLIGAKQDTDGVYYWTIQIGDADATWMLDDAGKKVRTTGDNSTSPNVSVAEDGGKLYWKVNGEWLLNNGKKVPATGEKGDKGDKGETGPQGPTGSSGSSGSNIFSAIDTNTDPGSVTLTLTSGGKITLPKASSVTIGFDSYEVFYCSPTDNEITLILPSTLKESDYNAIIATISNSNGTDMDIQTRSTSIDDKWEVRVTKPTFTSGVLNPNSAKVTLTLPQNKTNYKALLRVTIVDNKGKEFSVSRIIWFKADTDTNVIDNNAGDLSSKITNPTSVKQLSVIGSVSDDDFKYIRENLTSIEVLDLSRTNLTSLPTRAMAFYESMGLTSNTSLKTVILPETLTTIANSAFAMCTNLEEINIPANVRTLGKWMFEGCNQLAHVIIPAGITEIPAYALYSCGIESIEIPSTVTSIGEYAFNDCKKLVSANIPSGVTVLNEGLFAYCDNLQNVSLHDNITSIGDDVFCICEKLLPKSFILPSKVTSIGARAFSWTGLTSIKLPNGLTSIGQSAFQKCPIETIDLPSTLTSLGAVSFIWEKAATVICRSTTPPAINEYDDHSNHFPPFYQISSSCILKRPAGADYSGWNSYFGGKVQDI